MYDSQKLIVLGFDVRSDLDDAECSDWTQERRSTFLIRPDVKCPASVDTIVWPGIGPSNDMAPQGLWSSVSEIIERMPAIADFLPHSPVVIEVAVVADQQSSCYWNSVFHPRVNEGGPENRVFDSLGFDIADQYLLSGLSNCGHPLETLTNLRSVWSDNINMIGLIDKLDDAVALATVLDSLVPEHAPFYAYRIRQLRMPMGNL